MKKVILHSLLIVTFLISGCVSYNDNMFAPYSSGILEGKSIKIEAIDKSFSISEGQFTPPFQTESMPSIVWTPIFSVKAPGNPPYPYNTSLLDSFQLALKHGAKRVLVYHPASKTPLYGVLLLNQKWPKYTTGAAARSYYIRIPDNYVHSAHGGRVSVVYEPVNIDGVNNQVIGWALWLSDIPF